MRTWLAAILGATLGLLVYTALEPRLEPSDRRRDGEEFQRLVGGLGMGSTAMPYWDFSAFDPRLEPDCTCSLWPVPGGFLYSPEHRSTAWDPPENLWPRVTPEPQRGGRNE